MKRIIFCADDYGQNTAISQAIIELLKKKRLTATTCMTNADDWSVHAKWLLPFKDQIDIGLHFNLTEGRPLAKDFGSNLISHPQLIMKSYFWQLNQAKIEAELHAQIDSFVEGIGRLPDFIDGHQHIQQLPVIRDAIFNVYEKRLKKTNCYMRSVDYPMIWCRFSEKTYVKKLIIQFCGASSFKKLLMKYSVPHNASFSGVYDFFNKVDYAALFRGFLHQIQDGGLIMCHPGLNNLIKEDGISNARFVEYHYFSSDQFIQDCLTHKVTLTRFCQLEC